MRAKDLTDRILFPQGKQKAFAISFDDGHISDQEAAHICRKWQLPATFFLCSTFLKSSNPQYLSESQAQALLSMHEVGSHTYFHRNLFRENKSVAAYELLADKDNLEQTFKRPILGVAYPFGGVGNHTETLAENIGFVYGRTGLASGKFSLPENWYHWDVSALLKDAQLPFLFRQFLEKSPSRYQPDLHLFTIAGHAVELENKFIQKNLEDVFVQIEKNRESLWCTTFAEIALYFQAASRLHSTCAGTVVYNPTDKDIFSLRNGQIYCLKAGKITSLE